jgi:hypothetical protein
MFRFNHHLILNSAPHTHTHTHARARGRGRGRTDLIEYAATPPNQPQRCILTDYFNNYNISKAQIIRSLMMVIKPKHVGAVLL